MSISAFAAACGSTPPKQEGEPVSLESFGVLTADAVCALAFECCAESQRTDLPETEPECRSRVAAELNQELLPTIRAAVVAGELRYHEERYAGCLAQVVSAGCATARRYLDCVDDGFVPLVPAGGVCHAHAHCMDGACIGATSSTSGVCAVPLADGLECGSALECAGEACVGGVCRARMSLGQSCYADSQCESDRCDTLAHVCAPPSAAMCR